MNVCTVLQYDVTLFRIALFAALNFEQTTVLFLISNVRHTELQMDLINEIITNLIIIQC